MPLAQATMNRLWSFLIFLCLAVAYPLVSQAQEADAGAAILVLEVEGPVTPAMASYFERGIETAERDSAEAALIVLDTPGGSVDTTQKIIQLFRNATVPVIVYIGPPGAQAASAGSLITMAAHASGMAPDTVIGAASPVSGEGQDIGDTLYRKLVEDLKAQARSLTEARGEEAMTLAEAMIEEAKAVHAAEARESGLIDALAADVPTLLQELDGLEVSVGEETVTLNTASAPQTPFGMNVIEEVLHALSNPLLIGILLSIGVPAILIELKSPGGWVAGFIGVMSLGLAFYGLGQLPVNWFGLGLIGLAFVLFLLEIKAPGVGALAFVGAATLLGGLLVLFNSPGSPEFVRISIPSAVAITGVTSAFFLFIVTMAVRAQRQQPLTGREGLIGHRGHVRKSLVPAASGEFVYTGSVVVHGEIWQAKASEALKTNEEVIVTGMDGFTLQVKKKETPGSES